MDEAKKVLADFLAEEKKEEDKSLEAMLRRAEEDAKNKSLSIEIHYDKPVLRFFDIHKIVALIASDYLDKDGKPKFYFEECDGANVDKRVIDMKIDTFLGLAEPIPEDDENRHHSSVKQFLLDVVSGYKFDWDVPTLTIKKSEDDNWKVIGHDGRHRAMLLKKLGYKEMPVCIYFKRKDGSDGGWNIPYEDSDRWADVVYCQNDTFAERGRTKFTFPITKENCYSYYSRVQHDHGEMCGQGGECCCGTEDCDILKKTAKIEVEALKGAPKECLNAKKEFEKDKGRLLEVPVPPIKMEHEDLNDLLCDRERRKARENG